MNLVGSTRGGPSSSLTNACAMDVIDDLHPKQGANAVMPSSIVNGSMLGIQ